VYGQTENRHSKVPVAIHLIALLYVVQAAMIGTSFHFIKKAVSASLLREDVITFLLLLVPLIALWSIYCPNRYTRWFPLYGITCNWLIVYGIGSLLLDSVWQTASSQSDFSLLFGPMLTFMLLVIFTLWMLFAFLPLRFIPSAREYIFGSTPSK